MNDDGIVGRLARYAAGFDFAALPPEVVAAARARAR